MPWPSHPSAIDPDRVRGTITGFYPLGFPLLLAASLEIAGSLAPYVVTPLFLGLLAWCAFVLASELSTGWAGVAASLLIAATPVTLSHALMPMSDIPATAFWMASLIFSLRPGAGAATAAGLTTAMAIMVRPNLAPLGAILALVILASQGALRTRIVNVAVYGVVAAIGPAFVLWSQAALYGDPFAAGYIGSTSFFDRARIPANARFYPGLLLELHTALVLAGVLMIPLAFRQARQSAAHHRAALIAAASLGIIVVNYALYLPYLTFEGWYWLRFMMPGLTVLFVLFAAFVDWCRLQIATRSRIAAMTMAAPILFVAWHPQSQLRTVFTGNDMALRLALMGRYLKEALPENAVVLTYLHSAAVAVYTGRPIVRLDMVPPEKLDTIVDDLAPARLPSGVRPRSRVRRAVFSRTVRALEVRATGLAGARRVLQHDHRHLSRSRRPRRVLQRRSLPDRSAQMAGQRSLSRQLVRSARAHASDRHAGAAGLGDVHGGTSSEVSRHAEASGGGRRDRSECAARRGSSDISASGCTAAITMPPQRKSFSNSMDRARSRSVSVRSHRCFRRRTKRPRFRTQLEAKFSGHFTSFVDLEGQAVWVQEYLRHRSRNCSHRDAVKAVMAQIDGNTRPVACSAAAESATAR